MRRCGHVRSFAASAFVVTIAACGGGEAASADATSSESTSGGASTTTATATTSPTSPTDVTADGTTIGELDSSSSGDAPITEPMIEDCGHIDPRPPTTYDIFGERYGAAWGFVVGAREYAAFANTHGLSIIDVTEVPLVEVGYLELPGFVPGRALAGIGHTLYIGGQGPGGSLASLRIVDLTNPTQPTLIAERTEYTDQIHTMNVYDDVLHLNSGFGACRFLTLDTPSMPIEVGAYQGNDCHDALAVGDRLYVGGGYTQRWDIVDIANLASPMVLGVTNAEPGIYAHSGVLDASGNYLLGLDEFHIGDVWIYDVSNPGTPSLVTTFSLGADVIPHNARVRGSYVYAAWYEAGFVLLDIHDPTAPFEALRFSTWTDAPAAEWNGAIEVDLHLPSGKVLVSDSRSGLYVLCVETPP